LALFKGNKSETSQEAAPEAASARKGVIFRSRLDGAPAAAPPEPEPEVSDEGFEEGLGVPKASAPVSRVINQRTTIAPSNLPPITSSVRIPTGAKETQSPSPSEGGHNEQEAAPVVYQQPAVPVDQAIIEEAQQRAQQMMQEAQAAANQMLMEYQQQAQQMMEQANQQIQAAAEQVQQQAQEIGFQQGYEQGLQQGGLVAQQQVYQQLVESREIFIQAIRERHRLVASAEPELARLAIKIAERLVGEELKTNPETILGIVRLSLHGIGDREMVSLRVNPADYDQVVAVRSEFEKMIEGLKKFEVVVDAAIDPGGCAIETNLGNIDARLNTRIAALTAGLEDQVLLQEKEISEEARALQPDLPELAPPPEAHVPEEHWQEETQMEMAEAQEE